MSEEKHTQGRLRVSSGWLVTADTHTPIAEESPHNTRAENDANMCRLAACWNACDGLPTYALELGRMSPDAFRLNESRADRAERQRDDLLAALISLHAVARVDRDEDYAAVTSAADAIAKATGRTDA